MIARLHWPPFMAPTLLAIDTSTDELHAGLLAGGRRLARSEPGAARASSRLVPLLHEMMAEAGLRWTDLDALAYGRGPGAFTGLRTACAVAQGLALGAGKPVLPIDSLMIVAEDDGTAAATTELWVAMDARMDEIYAAGYRRDAAGGWAAAPAPALYTLPALHACWQAAPPRSVAGSAPAAFESRLDTAGSRRLPRGPDRAAALLRLAERAWHRGQAVDAAQALPLYLRDKVALTTAERAAAAAAR
jgi:tRNA threonylcarbamoyladenosine biosynthesis protein TsaB